MTPEEQKLLNDVRQELALFQQNQLRRNAEFVSHETLSAVAKAVADLAQRVTVLEGARKIQIALNEDFIKHNHKEVKPLDVAVKNVWSFFKKK